MLKAIARSFASPFVNLYNYLPWVFPTHERNQTQPQYHSAKSSDHCGSVATTETSAAFDNYYDFSLIIQCSEQPPP